MKSFALALLDAGAVGGGAAPFVLALFAAFFFVACSAVIGRTRFRGAEGDRDDEGGGRLRTDEDDDEEFDGFARDEDAEDVATGVAAGVEFGDFPCEDDAVAAAGAAADVEFGSGGEACGSDGDDPGSG